MLTVGMLLSLLLVSGARADCFTDLFITAPQKMDALSGSCLQIPCNFRAKKDHDFNNRQPTFGVWIKHDSNFGSNPSNVIFNSSGTVTTYPMNFTGNLIEKNCTTVFSSLLKMYTDVYFFRAENEPFKATASCDSLYITVRDSPPKPRIEISGELKEKESVSVSCSAFTPCPHSPPELTWTLQQQPRIMMEENNDRTLTTKIQTTIVLSDKHDGLTISCSARYPVNEGRENKTAEETKTLNVSYAPKDTSVSISPPGPVSAGSWVNLTCSSRANPPVSRFTWFKNGSDGAVSVSQGDFYSFNVTDEGGYHCVATNQLGSQTSPEIFLTIKGEVKSRQLSAVLGGIIGIIGIIVLIGLFACFWRLKSTHPTAQQSQNLTVEEAASSTSTREEDIHYGEIDFSRRGPEPASVQDSGQKQDTLYAQVNVSHTPKSSTQPADGPEDLYAQVKRK
ncbi:sialic acid-binding Ig-like lectin 12 [Clinocottus analis]|uniref:sialic acid-binding Ig-like lectin 12 n=1 Tax=Clinocottus analis TaxID=304258 RepID=UPI0035C00139